MGKEEERKESRFGIVKFEGRRHPRLSVDLAVEYWQINNSESYRGQTINVSEGGLMVCLPEKLEIDQKLRVKLFLGSGIDSSSIEAVVEVVWRNLSLGSGDYRVGVKFVDISPEDMDRLKKFLNSRMNLKTTLKAETPGNRRQPQ